MHLGLGEIVLVLVIALLVFGPSKLPQLGDALGKGIRAFKKATTEDDPAEPARGAAEQNRFAPHSPVAETTAGDRQPTSAER